MSKGFKDPSSNIGNAAGNLATNLIAESGVGELLSTKQKAKYSSGARTIIRINGVPLAFAFQVSWDITTAHQEIRTVDDYLPYELAPQMVQVTGSLGGWHIPDSGPTALNIQQNVLSFLFHRYITIEVRDRTTDALLFFTKNAVITSRSESISTDNLSRLKLDFKAIGWKDEKEPRLPNGVRGMQGKQDSANATKSSTVGKALNDVSNFVRNPLKGIF